MANQGELRSAIDVFRYLMVLLEPSPSYLGNKNKQ